MKSQIGRVLAVALLMLNASFALAKVDDKNWKALNDEDDAIRVFRHRANEERLLTLMKTPMPEDGVLTKDTVADFVKTMSERRQMTNSILGREKWQITKYELSETTPEPTVTLEGSYSEDGKEYHFFEVIKVDKSKYAQFQFVEPRGPASISKAEAMEILKEAAKP